MFHFYLHIFLHKYYAFAHATAIFAHCEEIIEAKSFQALNLAHQYLHQACPQAHPKKYPKTPLLLKRQPHGTSCSPKRLKPCPALICNFHQAVAGRGHEAVASGDVIITLAHLGL
jgi:hypothetical protein